MQVNETMTREQRGKFLIGYKAKAEKEVGIRGEFTNLFGYLSPVLISVTVKFSLLPVSRKELIGLALRFI